MTARRTLTITGVAGLTAADSNALGNQPDARETPQAADTPVRGGDGIQDFPSYSDIGETRLAEPVADEAWSFDVASGSAMAVAEIDGAFVLVAENVVGGEYGVGAWNLEDGSTMYSYPMYEHADRSINKMADGCLGDTVPTVAGDHGGDLRAWNVTANQEYGPAVNLDGSDITALAVVQLDGTLTGIAATVDRMIALWNVETDEIIEQFDSPGLGPTHLVVADIDGRPAAVAGGDSWAMPYRLG